ncbi:MAG: sulfurtransferase TusA family protein [Actinomycetota bacterium]|nr:sulfurtransferase TusA family protein [Actinomycetota bacterium]
MSGRAEPALVLDCRGRRCPLPILEVARRITGVPVGETVMVEADDPAAGPDLSAWCRIRGHEFLAAARASDGTPAYTLRRLH